MRNARNHKDYGNVVNMQGEPVRIRTAKSINNSPDAQNDDILASLLSNAPKSANRTIYDDSQKRPETAINGAKRHYAIEIDPSILKRIGLAAITFVMVCGLLKVTVPFVARKLARPVSTPQAARLASPLPVVPLPPLSPTQAATDKRMRHLERQVGKIETILTHVADGIQPPVRPVRHVTKRVVVIKEVKQEVKHQPPAIKRHKAARPVVKKQAEPVIINNDASQTEELF